MDSDLLRVNPANDAHSELEIAPTTPVFLQGISTQRPGREQVYDGSPSPHISDGIPTVWRVGDRFLDEFEVTEIIGQGGMGTVYKVHNPQLWITLAVKSPRPDIFARADGKQKFVREAETWGDLAEHPHIVTCRFVRTLGGIPRIFIDYVQGGSLTDWICQGRLYQGGPERTLERILDVAIQIAWGLHAAHEHKLIHQDVKPANVLLTPQGIAKVTDFGLAKARALAEEASNGEGNQGSLVSTGWMTPAYSSPEQADLQQLSHKTDIWSWGICVLDLFMGSVDRGAGRAAAKALENYLAAGPPNSTLPQMPLGVVKLLQRCFQHDPAARPATMQEVALELQAIYKCLLEHPYAREVPAFRERGVSGLYYQALSLRELERNEKALSVIEQCIRSFFLQAAASLTKGAILEGLHVEKRHAVWSSREADPDPQRAARYLNKNKGATLLELGDVQEALATWGQNIQLDPHQAAAHLDESATLLERGRFDQALAALKQDIRLDPHRLSLQQLDAHYDKDMVLSDLDRLKKALATYQWYLRRGPRSLFAHYYEVSPLRRFGMPTTYQQKIQFDSPPLHHSIPGMVPQPQGRAKEAEAFATFDQILQFDPQDALVHFGKGARLYELGCVEEALAAFDQGLRLDPQLAFAYFGKGVVLHSLGRFIEALAAFDQGLRLDPQLAFAYFGKSAALNSLGRFTEALAACKQSIRLDRQQAVTYRSAYQSLYFTLLELGRVKEVLATCDQDLPSAFADYSKGTIPQRLGYVEQADAHYYQGLVLNSRRRFTEALAAYGQCLQLDPQRADAHFGRGVALLGLGLVEEALAAYECGLQLDPWQTAAHFNRGLLLGDLAHYGSESGTLASVGVLRYPGQVISTYRPPKIEADKPLYPHLRVVVLFLVGFLFYLWVPLDRPSSFSLIQAVISRVLEGFYIYGGLSFAILLLAEREVKEAMGFKTRVKALTRMLLLGVLCFVVQIIWFRPDFTLWGEVMLVALFVLWTLLIRGMKQIADYRARYL